MGWKMGDSGVNGGVLPEKNLSSESLYGVEFGRLAAT